MADDQPSFEASLGDLEKVVGELEAGDLPLERSLELFEKGMALSESCRKQLEEAETRIETLVRRDGKVQAEIGRASCRERGEGGGGGVWVRKRMGERGRGEEGTVGEEIQ